MPLKWSSLAVSLAMLAWLGPFMMRMFGMDNGPFFYYLGFLIALLNFAISRERRFHEMTGYRWFILFSVAGWVGFEMVRATFIPLVATSAFIGYTQSTQPWLTQPVSIFSVYGLNTVIMLVNFALAQAIIAWNDRKLQIGDVPPVGKNLARNGLLVAGITLVLWVGVSLGQLVSAPKDVPVVRVAAIQPGYEKPAFQDETNTSQVRLEAFAADVRKATSQGAKIIYTPEMMFNFDPQVEYSDELRALAAETGAILFLDYTVSIEGQAWRNESIMLSPTGEFSQVYGKNKNPPGEPSTSSSGVYPVFDTPLGRLATEICHDANYTGVSRRLAANGAQLTGAGLNEFGGFGEQYWSNVSFRGIENRMGMVVAARQTGSAIINPDGSPAALDLERNKHLVLVGDVRLGQGGAPYTKLGDILGWVMLGLFVVSIIYPSVVSKRMLKEQAVKPE
jgi:apolipoprotein N-acyltransferase